MQNPMSPLRVLQRPLYPALIVIAAMTVAAPAQSQIKVDVRNADTGERIASVVKSRIEGNEEELGRVSTSKALEKQLSCEGREISVRPLMHFIYEQQSEEWMSCKEDLVVEFRPLGIASYGFTVPNESGSIPFFTQLASNSSTSADFFYFQSSLEQGNTQAASIASKDLAELLEAEGQQQEAEIFWTISAQAAVTAMAEEQGVTDIKAWLNPTSEKVEFTQQGQAVIRSYQIQQNLPPVGVIGQRTFSAIAESAIAQSATAAANQ